MDRLTVQMMDELAGLLMDTEAEYQKAEAWASMIGVLNGMARACESTPSLSGHLPRVRTLVTVGMLGHEAATTLHATWLDKWAELRQYVEVVKATYDVDETKALDRVRTLLFVVCKVQDETPSCAESLSDLLDYPTEEELLRGGCYTMVRPDPGAYRTHVKIPPACWRRQGDDLLRSMLAEVGKLARVAYADPEPTAYEELLFWRLFEEMETKLGVDEEVTS